MSQPRAHHYLPVFYLRGFTSESPKKDIGFLWVYEKGKPPRRSKPENEAHERDFYSHNRTERLLSKIESVVAPFFRAVEDGYSEFHPDDWEGITCFMALTWLRGPTGRDFVNGLYEWATESAAKQLAENAEEFAKFYQRFLESSGTNTNLSAEEMRTSILSNNWSRITGNLGAGTNLTGSRGYQDVAQLFYGFCRSAAELLRCLHSYTVFRWLLSLGVGGSL